MAANVLRSKRAIATSVFVARTFLGLREMVSSEAKILKKLEELEERIGRHDKAIRAIVKTIRQLMAPAPRTPRIGFDVEEVKE